MTTGNNSGNIYIDPNSIWSIQVNTGGTWQTIAVPATPVEQITLDLPETKKKSEGCSCKKCKEFYPYAEPNQLDGTLICYACRHGF